MADKNDVVINNEEQPEIKESIITKSNRLMQELFTMKAYRFAPVMEARADYEQQLRTINESNDDIQYHTNTGFAIVNQKHSEIMSATPRYDIIPMDDTSKQHLKAIKMDWDYEWKMSNTDDAICKAVHGACLEGVGWLFEEFLCEYREVNTPIIGEDNKITFKKEKIKYKEGCSTTVIPWENVMVNGRDMEEATQAVIFRYFTRDEFLRKFGDNPLYTNVSNEEIPRGKFYYIGASSSGEYSFNLGSV